MDHPATVVLRDGTRALLRPIQPDDKWRLKKGLSELSPRSRYLRFHSPVTHLTDPQLQYLTEVDHRNHEAVIALDPDNLDEPGMGVARCVRLPEDPAVAEAAVVVLDEYQGRGVGTALLMALAASAIEQGIHSFRNYVLADNVAMFDIFERLGVTPIEEGEGEGVCRVEVPLPTDIRELSRSMPHETLRAAAKGLLPPWHIRLPGFPWSATRQRLRRREDDPRSPHDDSADRDDGGGGAA